MDILKIAMIGMTGVCLAIPLKSYKAEYGMLISLGTCVCIFIYLVTKLEIVVEYIGRIETVLNLDGGYIRLMLKMMGITYVAQFAAEICKDAGYGAVGSQIELFGKVSILFVSMPVLLALLQTVGDFYESQRCIKKLLFWTLYRKIKGKFIFCGNVIDCGNVTVSVAGAGGEEERARYRCGQGIGYRSGERSRF